MSVLSRLARLFKREEEKKDFDFSILDKPPVFGPHVNKSEPSTPPVVDSEKSEEEHKQKRRP